MAIGEEGEEEVEEDGELAPFPLPRPPRYSSATVVTASRSSSWWITMRGPINGSKGSRADSGRYDSGLR